MLLIKSRTDPPRNIDMIRGLFNDRTYYRTLFRLVIPIVIQYFISAAMNIIDVAMMGHLGETAVAAVGISNQAFFILILFLFGVSSGSAIFTAQFWGQRDVPNIRRVLGLCLSIASAGGLIFTIVAVFFPGSFLGLFSPDPAVIQLGSQYLHIVGFSYLVTAVTFSYYAVLRSTEEVRLPMLVSGVAILIKTGLSYLLIFGHLGLPAMGVVGAGVGTVVARFLECGILLFLVYYRKTAAAARLSELNGFRSSFLGKYFRTALPVVVNELAWSIGVSLYNVAYGHISTQAIAAVNIVSSVENLAFVAFMALSDSTGIMIGNHIGMGNESKAMEYGRRSLTLNVLGAWLMGVIILLNLDNILSIYGVSELAREYSHNVLLVSALVLWVRVSNMMIIVGILRAGGDTRFCVFLDVGTVWLVGVPMAFLGALVLKLPVYFVYPLVTAEEFVKFGVGIRRLLSGKWLNNLAAEIAIPKPDPSVY